MKNIPLSLGAVALVFGILTATQFKSDRRQTLTHSERSEDLILMLRELESVRENMQEKIKSLRDKLSQYEKEASSGKELLEAIRSELESARLLAGLAPAEGPGVEVVINDNKKKPAPDEDPNLYLVHQEDLLNIINELNAGGAEAIAINDQRIAPGSSIRCIGPVVLVNSTRLAPPYFIRAIGDPNTLYASLTMPGGIVDTLKMIGLQIEVQKRKEVKLPAMAGSLTMKHAKPVESS